MKRTLCAVLFASAIAAQVQPVRLTLEDLLSEGGARGGRGGLALTPDGKYFAGTANGQVVPPVGGGAAVPFTSAPGEKSELSWSPDGRKVAYVSQGAVWVATQGSSEALRLSEGKAGPGDPRGATDHVPRWNPKGKWILYQSGRSGQNELYVVSDDGKVTNRVAAAEIYEGADHLGDAVSSDRFNPEPAWSPDGARISFTERSRKFFSGKLTLLRFDQSSGLVKGAPTVLYIAKNDRGGAWAVNTATWSPDSRQLAVILQESGWDKVWLIPSSGGKARQLTFGESEDENPVYSPDGRSIAIVSNRDNPEERHIWIVPLDGSAPRRLTNLAAGIESGPVWSPDGKTIYFHFTSPLNAGGLYFASLDGSEPAHPNGTLETSKFERAGVSAPDVVRFPGKDGVRIAGILNRPAGFQTGTRYPAVIWAHGGPEGQDTVGFSP